MIRAIFRQHFQYLGRNVAFKVKKKIIIIALDMMNRGEKRKEYKQRYHMRSRKERNSKKGEQTDEHRQIRGRILNLSKNLKFFFFNLQSI